MVYDCRLATAPERARAMSAISVGNQQNFGLPIRAPVGYGSQPDSQQMGTPQEAVLLSSVTFGSAGGGAYFALAGQSCLCKL
jgi:hypothetical protein